MNALIHTHSGLRWIALILLLVAIFRAFARKNGGVYDKSDRLINLFAMVSIHTQILIGLILAFISPKVNYTSGWMKVPYLRFFGMEHALLMVIAAVLITIGHKKAKTGVEIPRKHNAIAVWYTIALILILAGIPWPFREVLGGKWF